MGSLPNNHSTDYASLEALRRRSHFARIFGYSAWFAAVLLAVFCLTAIAIQRAQYYVVALDPLGRASVLPDVATLSTFSDAVERRFVIEYVERFRSISSDPEILKRDIQVTGLMTQPGSPAMVTYRSIELGPEDLRRDVKSGISTRSVSVLRNERNNLGWIVEWVETTREYASGRAVSSKRFQATITLTRSDPDTLANLANNPTGLMVNTLDIQRITERSLPKEGDTNDLK
jgi:type IV secretory pathway TrbF-like protein